ncbi:MAG: putative hydroxymethylpyrimidine transporter CytX, partial [Herbinix sp.]|nr:putative hydroxymethylpyrimidine transporter CytX [Herbinix sp.]
APMIAIQIADYFILKKEYMTSKVNIINLLIWLVGFIIYRMLMHVNIIVGNTLPDMVITIVICVLINKIIISVKRPK